MNYIWKLWTNDLEFYTVATNPDDACPPGKPSIKGIRRLRAIPLWDSWTEEQRQGFVMATMMGDEE